MKYSYKIIILLVLIYIFNSCTKDCLLNPDCNEIKNILNQNWEVYWTIKEYKHDTLKGVYQNQGSFFPGIFLDTTVYSLKEISENHMTMTRNRQRIDVSDTFDVFINGIFRRN